MSEKHKPEEYHSVKLKASEYQMLVAAKETLKMYGLEHLLKLGFPIANVKNFDFTLGEVSSLACLALLRKMQPDLNAGTRCAKKAKK